MRVGFAGLGAIGAPMAAHIAPRHELQVWNRTASRSEDFTREHRATIAPTPRDLARDSEVIVTCLPTSAEVEALLEGPDGILAGIRPGTLFLDCTSGEPGASRRMAARLAERGVAFADAPVSGGTDGAAAAALTVMVGGDPEVLERARPVLECFGSRILLLGPVGSAHAMKAVNNALLAVNILAVGEGLAVMVKAGVKAPDALAVLNASSGRSFVSEKLVPERVLPRTWPVTFRLALLEKDVRIATDLAEQERVQAPLLDLTAGMFAAARAQLGEEADYLEAIKLIEQQAGVELKDGK